MVFILQGLSSTCWAWTLLPAQHRQPRAWQGPLSCPCVRPTASCLRQPPGCERAGEGATQKATPLSSYHNSVVSPHRHVHLITTSSDTGDTYVSLKRHRRLDPLKPRQQQVPSRFSPTQARTPDADSTGSCSLGKHSRRPIKIRRSGTCPLLRKGSGVWGQQAWKAPVTSSRLTNPSQPAHQGKAASYKGSSGIIPKSAPC